MKEEDLNSIKDLDAEQLSTFLTHKDRFVDIDLIEAEIVLNQEVDNLSEKEIILQAYELGVLSQIFKQTM